jgi:hypothetical protein
MTAAQDSKAKVFAKLTPPVFVRRAIGPAAFPPEQPEHLRAALMADITRKQNPNPQRRNRTYPRVVKRARHNSSVKRAEDRGIRHAGAPAIKLANLGRLSLAA